MAADPIYAVGDIHGHMDKLQTIMARIEQDGGHDAQVIFLGDYVDRGPDSRAVIDYLANGMAAGRNWTCLKGNHDRMFAMFMEQYPRNDARLLIGYHWFHKRLGGVETLASYGVEVTGSARIYQVHEAARRAVPPDHITFLNELTVHHQQGDWLFVHAGLRPGTALADQTEDDLIWIREPFLNHPDPHPWCVVHGHSPVAAVEHHGNRIAVDTGAGHGRALSAVVLEAGACFALDEAGRVPVRP